MDTTRRSRHPRPGRTRRASVALLAFATAAAVAAPAAAAPLGSSAGGACATPTDAGFRDVPDDAYYADAANCLAALEVDGTALVGGYPDGTFRSTRMVTRADAAQFVVRLVELVGGRAVEGSATSFDDLDRVGPRQRAAIAALVELDVVAGTSATTYSPDRLLTRGQTAALLVRADRAARGLRAESAPSLAEALYRSQQTYYYNAGPQSGSLDVLAAAGIYRGIDAGVFGAGEEQPLTRGQLVALEARYLQYVTDDTPNRAALLDPSDQPDASSFDWYLAGYGNGEGLDPTVALYDPCDGTTYATDAGRSGGWTRQLTGAAPDEGLAFPQPRLRQQVATYGSEAAAVDAVEGLAAVTRACPSGEEFEGAAQRQVLDLGGDDALVVETTLTQASPTYEGPERSVRYVLAVRRGTTVSLATLFLHDASNRDAATATLVAMRDELTAALDG